MKKLEMIAKFYGRNLSLKERFHEAEKVNDEKGMEVCREGYERLLQEVRVEGEDFGNMMRLYSEMKKRGNERLDLSGTCRDPERIIRVFREFGVTEFTFSSNWTNAMDTAWAFTKMGCNLKGMVEIYSDNKKFMGNEYEKGPAFLFTL